MSKKETKNEAPKNNDIKKNGLSNITHIQDLLGVIWKRSKNDPEETSYNLVFKKGNLKFHFNRFSNWKINKISRDGGKTWTFI